MKNIQKKITDIGWQQMVTEEINEKGYTFGVTIFTGSILR